MACRGGGNSVFPTLVAVVGAVEPLGFYEAKFKNQLILISPLSFQSIREKQILNETISLMTYEKSKKQEQRMLLEKCCLCVFIFCPALIYLIFDATRYYICKEFVISGRKLTAEQLVWS